MSRSNRNEPQDNPVTTLARREAHVESWRDPEWQRLWLALQSRAWRSLALVPAGEGGPDDFTLSVAVNLSRTGMVHLGSPIQVADAAQVQLGHLERFLAEVQNFVDRGDRILLALPPASKSPLTTSIAQASEASLLCVLLERMASSDAKRIVDQVGAARFIGSAIFRPDQIKGS